MLKDKVIIVTGARSGIGLATAQILAQADAKATIYLTAPQRSFGPPFARGGGKAHKVAKALCVKERQDRGDAVEHALEVDIDHLLPSLDVKRVERRDWLDPGVADQHVQAATACHGRLGQADEVFGRVMSTDKSTAQPPAATISAASA